MNLCSLCLPLISILCHSPNEESSLNAIRQRAIELQNVPVAIDHELGTSLKSQLLQKGFRLRQFSSVEAEAGRHRNLHEELLCVIAETGKSNPDFEKLNQCCKQFYGARKCLNRKECLEFRDALRRYVYWLRTSQENDPIRYQQIYQSHLQTIADELKRHPHNPNLAEMAASINWLAHSGHGQDLIAEWRTLYAHPSVMIDLNPKLGSVSVEDLEQNVSRTEYTSNMIAGAQVSGDSHFTGTFRAKILDNPERATVRIYLQDGLIKTADSIGRKEIPLLNGNVFVKGSAKTTIEQAYVDLYFDGRRLMCVEPQVQCKTESQIKDVGYSRNYLFPGMKRTREALGLGPSLMERVIEIQALQASRAKKNQAESESAAIAAKNLTQSIKTQIKNQLRDVAGQIEEQLGRVIEPTFLRHGIYFDRLLSQSSPDRVRIAFEKRGLAQLGAPQALVEYNQEMGDALDVMIHESSFLNFFTEVASGARWDDQTWAYLQKTVTGLNSYSFMIGVRERWTSYMDWDAPVSFRFDNDCMTLSFCIRKFEIGDKKYAYPFRVSADYRPRLKHYGVDLQRQGDLKIEWLQEVPRDEYFVNFVRETFDDFLQESQHWDSLIIPYGGSWGGMDKFRFGEVKLQNGWLIASASPNEEQKKQSIFVSNQSGK